MVTGDYLKHIVAAHIEQARKDYEENRRLWREQQNAIARVGLQASKHIEERDFAWDRQLAQLAKRLEQFDRRMEQMRQEMADRDERMCQHISELVSAIGHLITTMERHSTFLRYKACEQSPSST